jgi:ABC-2 type transport system permease protein
MRLSFLIEKEFKQFRRNTFLPRMAIVFPIMIMIVMPWVATLDIKGLSVAVVDRNCSPFSSRLCDKISASEYFNLVTITGNYDDAVREMQDGRVDLILSIPQEFSRKIGGGEKCTLFVAVNAVNGTKGLLGGNYMAQVIGQFNSDLFSERGDNLRQASLSVLNLYNPTLNYRQFMIPALVAVLIIMMCGFLPALNIVSEKEHGTIEQINVTPVGKFEFILAKLIPYWVIGLVVLTICFLLSWLIYDYLPAGSFVVIYSGTILFILGISSFGLIISNYSQTMQQSMLVMFFFILIFNLMNGLFTPVRSMPEWAQWMSAFMPPRYFIEIMRGVYQRGSGFVDLLPQFAALVSFAFLLGTAAILTYRKQS